MSLHYFEEKYIFLSKCIFIFLFYVVCKRVSCDMGLKVITFGRVMYFMKAFLLYHCSINSEWDHISKVPFIKDYKIEIIVHCYHLVKVVSFGLA